MSDTVTKEPLVAGEIETKTTHMVEFFYPGVIVSESQCKETDDTDPLDVVMPENAFAFQLYDRVTRTVLGEAVGVATIAESHRENETVIYYPGGEILTVDDVAAMGGKYEILLSNMRANNWDAVIRSRRGVFQPKTKDTQILP